MDHANGARLEIVHGGSCGARRIKKTCAARGIM
ncbi:hypothetical protein IBTHAUMO2_740006 [Nitrosopumilaceae archaeon]|nr:hypothetical protein IBTHAUMO2_740006 [Nitrosopumilaceae archaeon]